MKKFLPVLLALFLLLPIFCYAEQSGIRVRKSSSQTIPTDEYTQLQYDIIDFDLLGEWSTSTHRFTAQQSGYYSVLASVFWSNSVDQKRHRIYIQKNGADTFQGSIVSSGTSAFNHFAQGIIYTNAGDRFEVVVEQTTGANRVAHYVADGTYFQIWKIDEVGNGGGAVAWGNITGTLSNQTDLQEVLDDLNMSEHYELIQNTSTGAEFYIEKTINYGEAFFILLFILILIFVIGEKIFKFFWSK